MSVGDGVVLIPKVEMIAPNRFLAHNIEYLPNATEYKNEAHN